MPRQSPAWTPLRLLLADAMRPGESMHGWCRRVGFPVRTMQRLLLHPDHHPRLGTATLLAKRLGVTVERLRAALQQPAHLG